MELSELFAMGKNKAPQSLSLGEIPQSGYRSIMISPQWAEMTVAEACSQVQKNALWRPAENCHLWLWSPSSYLKDAMNLMERLGFAYLNSSVWVKGFAQSVREQHDLLLIGRRGRPFVGHHFSSRQSSVIYAERTDGIPDSFYDHIETLSNGPYLEVFSHSGRNGWHSSKSAVVEVSL